MKKIVFAVALCASASFSPALAQSAMQDLGNSTITGTFSRVNNVSSFQITVNVAGRMTSTIVQYIFLNRISLLSLRGLDPDAANKLSGATCVVSGHSGSMTADCTK